MVLISFHSPSMVKLNLGQSTRCIYLGLACLSLILHLLLAFYCLSVLQTTCVLPTSSSSTSSSIPRTDTRHHHSVSHSSSSSAARSSNKLPTSPQIEERHKPAASVFDHKGNGSFSEATEKAKKLTGAGEVKQKGHSKLEELFKHPLYNLPHPELQQDDWLLRLKTDEDARDTRSLEEEMEMEDSIPSDSEW